MFKNKRVVYVHDVNEMNEHIKYCKIHKMEAPSEAWASLQKIPKLYYTLDVLYTRIILRYHGNGNLYTTYIFQLDGSEHPQTISGLRAFNLLQRMSNKGVVDLTRNYKWYNSYYDSWNVGPIGGLIYFNKKLMGQRYENCIEYDRRSAYACALMEPIPDTKVLPRENDYIKPGEVGFKHTRQGYSNDEQFYAIFEPGIKAEYVYPLIESPFKNFATYYYNKKLNATGLEYDRAKQILNYAIGYIRRKNPFVHSCILSRSRYFIEKLIDKDTLYCNTDSLVTRKPREDLEHLVGDEIGKFKVQHKGAFAYTESGYQWNNDLPSVRGKSKKWFENAYPNGFDILTDTLPFIEANKYYYDNEKGEICLCQEEENIKESIKPQEEIHLEKN